MKVTDWPNTEGLAEELTEVVVTMLDEVTRAVEVLVVVEPFVVQLLSAAVTVKLYVVFGVNPVVLTVSVAVAAAPVLVTDAGENEKNPPGGGEGHAVPLLVDGVALRFAVQEVLLPLKPTVTV